MASFNFMPKFDAGDDLAESLNSFRTQWKNYEIASGLVSQSIDVRVASLKLAVVHLAVKYLEDVKWSKLKDESSVIDYLLHKLEECIVPKQNITYNQYVFNKCIQGHDSFNSYLEKIKNLANKCEFGKLREEMLRDKIQMRI